MEANEGLICKMPHKINILTIIRILTNKKEEICLINFFNVSDVMKFSLVSKSFNQIFNNKTIENCIKLGNLDSYLRPFFWLKLCPIYSLYLHRLIQNYRKVLQISDLYETPYTQLVNLSTKSKKLDNAFRDIRK